MGGNFGLCLGGSLLSLVEVFDLLIQVIYLGLLQIAKRERLKIEIKLSHSEGNPSS